ncbi:ABC transporter permease [Nonomuraea sp. NPDC050310]|uniref:ABC transporter permease n=1 Tax=Nonomuraea sp. NPDC050310 TaxID=3154935 RepID=UPI0033F398D7
MLAFIARRLATATLVLLVATFIMYVLVALSGDPLADLREQNTPEAQQKMAFRTKNMQLDVPVPLRYLSWLAGVFRGDLGISKNGEDVASMVGSAMTATLQLVVIATVLGAVIGITIGIVSALRQYSAFDHAITFAAFVCFSLPLFWVATMLKQYVAIEFNTWLKDPTIPIGVIAAIAVLAGLLWAAVFTGSAKLRLSAFAIGLVSTGAVLFFLSETHWFADPGLGLPFIAIVSLLAAAGLALLISGYEHPRPLYAALAAAAVGILLYLPLQSLLADPSVLELLGFALLTVVVCAAIGYGVGGLLRRQAIPLAIASGLFTAALIFVDRLLQAWDSYSASVNGRPIATIGSATPNYTGDFWHVSLDAATHLLLPTLALILVGLASHSRYSRASMLEVMNQDYVRTARAKGLPERTVIVKHAFRNGMIPITTILALDFAGVVGGAVVTESVFGWKGMGSLFTKALHEVDPLPVMGFFLVVGISIVLWNMIADVAYAYLDPRIRLS